MDESLRETLHAFLPVGLGVLVVVLAVLVLRLHAFLALLSGALAVGLAVHHFDLAAISRVMAAGFGKTCQEIGILVALASIVGACMLESGAADRLVRSALRVVGETRAALGFIASGFVLGIPVFFDTVFYLMIPLGKALRMRTGRNYLLYVLSIVAGATMTHSLVPPTPGPLYVAEKLGVDIGRMMLGGCLVGAVACVAGYGWASWANRRWNIPLRETPDVSLDDLAAVMSRESSTLPPLWLSLLPILLPVALIGGRSLGDGSSGAGAAPLAAVVYAMGDKNVALTISAMVALAVLVVYRGGGREATSHTVQSSLASAGIIILITGAGGAFGATLKETDIARVMSSGDLQLAPVGWIVAAFAFACLIRTAQGSATVAMMTAADVFAGMLDQGQPPADLLYLALAIGCGSKPVSWMNDSGFWVISRMSGLTERETLKSLTPMTAIMGVAGLAAVLVGSAIWP